MDNNALRRLLILQETDMRLRDMETRLTILPKEMNNIIAKRDKAMESTAAAVAAVPCDAAKVFIIIGKYLQHIVSPFCAAKAFFFFAMQYSTVFPPLRGAFSPADLTLFVTSVTIYS